MPNQVSIGEDPVYKQGDALRIQYTVTDQAGAPIDLQALGLSEVTFVLANSEGGTPILTLTLTGNPTQVIIVNPPGTDGRIDVILTTTEIQLEPGPLTGAYGPFIITAASAPP